MTNPDGNTLKWRFDVSAFRLIGRELITDRITALFELVKNSYDANSKRVDIFFENVSSLNPQSQIIIKDDGYGMDFDDIRDKWMVIGTSNKRENPYSPAPFNRRCVGEKGIGRFAVDKLGDKVNIITKRAGKTEQLDVEIDWNNYESSLQQPSTALNENTETEQDQKRIPLFTDIENRYIYKKAKQESHGTTLVISGIREIWTKSDIDRLYKELTKLVSPFYPLTPPFDIYISSNEYNTYNEPTPVEVEDVKYASHSAEIGFNNEINSQEELYFDESDGQIKKRERSFLSFGPVSIKLFYFDESAKKRYHAQYKNEDRRIDGVKIYRDGLITTPFAEFEAHPDKKRDILGIDKRLWRDIFNRMSTRDIIGVVDITKEKNPNIVDATNRQDFIDNQEYRELKEFIISQIDVFTQLRIYERKKEKNRVDKNLENASKEVIEFMRAIETVGKNNPSLKRELSPLKEQAKQVNIAVKKGISEHKKAEKEFLRKENVYLSLMSLQDYAANMSHAVRTSLGKIKDMAEFFKKYYPNKDLEPHFKLYAKDIYSEMDTLSKVINYMLSYAGSNIPFEDLQVKDLIKNLFGEYQLRFENENIKPIIEILDDFIIHANRQFFADILQNLIDNSIKALKDRNNKIIKCSGFIDNNHFILLFSDNGSGINKDDKEKVFELYHTTTAEEGGAGLGLFIVKTRIESLKGAVEVTDSEFDPVGTTFKISLPFKK